MKSGFGNNILIIGYGAVSQCTLPIFLDHIDAPREKITVIDFEDKSSKLKPFTDTGIRFVNKKITPGNLTSVLNRYAGRNGLIVDLAWNIETMDVLAWCHDNNTLYADTSVEVWDPYRNRDIFEKTLYWRQMQIKALKEKLGDSPTAVLDHGANPGLISHFTKQGLLDIADRAIEEGKFSGKPLDALLGYKKGKDFPNLARTLGVKVIHCSERDTQITNRPKEVDEFVNTWSIEGFREEGIAPAEMGWGTHEKKRPPLAFEAPYGPKNQIFLAQMGMNTRVKSYVPEVGPIEGMIIRHGEAFGISDRLTVYDGDGLPIYRPTVHYAYMPCHEAIVSLAELRARNYELQPKLRIMTDEITAGKDILGALLMGHPYNSWWTGSILSIEETRRLAPGQNATTLQVAAGIVSAVKYMIENPRKGILLPDDIPHDYILDIARPYLGELHSSPYDWSPLKGRTVFFKENPEHSVDRDPWQFECFRPLP
ncbi:MAG: saccharopine dehydrogenase NADP-binding domain-containing protein [Deltaproteobacteria bacterium]|nr:saccharopine dehydrogenase NADP-binding domain-containing protein [Deltaproteobacteria bacterium]MCL5276936.1 saccharopine dehydrogenase NADP-binding domain-containing protein [Deltaproteobacteria bacterium]